MNIEFAYLDGLLKFAQVLTLGAVLSIVVMYIIEILKNVIVTRHTNIFALLCFVISMAFGITWSLTFSGGIISCELSVWLGLCLWLGANGFFKYLENSDSWLGRTVKSYSVYLKEVAIKQESPIIDELKKENEALKQQLQTLEDTLEKCEEADGGNLKDGEETKTDSEESKPSLPSEKPVETPKEVVSKLTFKCGCNGKYCDGYPAKIDETLMYLLEEIYNKFSKDINVISALRCTKYNEELPGSLTSRHLTGKAVDFSFEGMNKTEVIDFLNDYEETDYVYTNSTNMKDMIHLQVK